MRQDRDSPYLYSLIMSAEHIDSANHIPPTLIRAQNVSEGRVVRISTAKHQSHRLAEFIVGLHNNGSTLVEGQEDFFNAPPPSGTDIYKQLEERFREIGEGDYVPQLSSRIVHSARVMPDGAALVRAPSHIPNRNPVIRHSSSNSV